MNLFKKLHVTHGYVIPTVVFPMSVIDLVPLTLVDPREAQTPLGLLIEWKCDLDSGIPLYLFEILFYLVFIAEYKIFSI